MVASNSTNFCLEYLFLLIFGGGAADMRESMMTTVVVVPAILLLVLGDSDSDRFKGLHCLHIPFIIILPNRSPSGLNFQAQALPQQDTVDLAVRCQSPWASSWPPPRML